MLTGAHGPAAGASVAVGLGVFAGLGVFVGWGSSRAWGWSWLRGLARDVGAAPVVGEDHARDLGLAAGQQAAQQPDLARDELGACAGSACRTRRPRSTRRGCVRIAKPSCVVHAERQVARRRSPRPPGASEASRSAASSVTGSSTDPTSNVIEPQPRVVHERQLGGGLRRVGVELREQHALAVDEEPPVADLPGEERLALVHVHADLVGQRDRHAGAREGGDRGQAIRQLARAQREHVRPRGDRERLQDPRLARPGRARDDRPPRAEQVGRREAVQRRRPGEDREQRARPGRASGRRMRGGPGACGGRRPRVARRGAAPRAGPGGRRAPAGHRDGGSRAAHLGRSGTVRRWRTRARSRCEGEVDDPPADPGEVVAALGAQGREQADRREARDGVDLGHDERLARHQEVDPGEALRPDRPVRVPGELEDRRPLGRGRRPRSRWSGTGPACTWPGSRRTRGPRGSRPARRAPAPPARCPARTPRGPGRRRGTARRARGRR